MSTNKIPEGESGDQHRKKEDSDKAKKESLLSNALKHLEGEPPNSTPISNASVCLKKADEVNLARDAFEVSLRNIVILAQKVEYDESVLKRASCEFAEMALSYAAHKSIIPEEETDMHEIGMGLFKLAAAFYEAEGRFEISAHCYHSLNMSEKAEEMEERAEAKKREKIHIQRDLLKWTPAITEFKNLPAFQRFLSEERRNELLYAVRARIENLLEGNSSNNTEEFPPTDRSSE